MTRIFLTFLLTHTIHILSAQNPYPKIFNDDKLLTLRQNVSEHQISSIKESGLKALAKDLLNDTYDSANRYKEYEAFLHPEVLAKKIKTSPYSQYENPTGIYFEKGDKARLWIHNPEKAKISLRVTNWDDENFEEKNYPLKNGYNTIPIENKGNSYIQYFTREKSADLPNMAIHIFSGKINGVFDISKHTNKDWEEILENAYGTVIDLVGSHVQLAYSVKSLQEYTNNEGVELVQLYDSIVSIQHEIMGLKKTNRVPKNRMFARVIWQGFMHADGIGAAFHDNTMNTLANVEKAKKNSWGIAHEFGHVNQVRPDMKWVGTTEVTNNIYSVWTQYLFNPDEPKLEREKLKDYDEDKIGGRITAYMESVLYTNSLG